MDDGRIDGRGLRAPEEPGSDALLLRGLMALVARIWHEQHPEKEK
jgi:hypothetical protein